MFARLFFTVPGERHTKKQQPRSAPKPVWLSCRKVSAAHTGRTIAASGLGLQAPSSTQEINRTKPRLRLCCRLEILCSRTPPYCSTIEAVTPHTFWSPTSAHCEKRTKPSSCLMHIGELALGPLSRHPMCGAHIFTLVSSTLKLNPSEAAARRHSFSPSKFLAPLEQVLAVSASTHSRSCCGPLPSVLHTTACLSEVAAPVG